MSSRSACRTCSKGAERPSGEWHTWAYAFTTWLCSQFKKGEAALEWAQAQTAEITPEQVRAQADEEG
eukprot:6152283-Lingulodinium_polyedra.AAC.1